MIPDLLHEVKMLDTLGQNEVNDLALTDIMFHQH
jgi:hypothetical protein